MRVILKPFAVLVACPGCPPHGHAAREAAAELERRGEGENCWLGAGAERIAEKVRSRWPVYAVDACAEGCARTWLEDLGVSPQRSYTLDGTGLHEPEA